MRKAKEKVGNPIASPQLKDHLSFFTTGNVEELH
jgi:hypothetical protein